jgi:hypothetical protein
VAAGSCHGADIAIVAGGAGVDEFVAVAGFGQPSNR